MGLFSKKTELIVGKDELRPNMTRVYFKNDFLYVTDSHVALKQNLSLFGFSVNEIKNLNNRSIDLDDWLVIRKFKVHSPTDEGIVCKTKNTELFFKYKDREFRDQKMADNIENLFEKTLKFEKTETRTFSLNTKLLNNLSQAMFLGINNALTFKSKGRNRAVIVWSTDKEYSLDMQIGLIMPVSENSIN